MLTIRPFCNADLPGLLEVWLGHWQAAKYQVHVGITALERATIGRLFFRPDRLLVATVNDRIVAWNHRFVEVDPVTEECVATIPAFCFSGEEGLHACDELLMYTESACAAESVTRIKFGVHRDDHLGYTGLAPLGHGIGVPTADTRTASMLSRHGYQNTGGVNRLVTNTSMYRVRANRNFLQLRRRTRIDQHAMLPSRWQSRVALSHFDLLRYELIDHHDRQTVATMDLWLSDVEGLVMNGNQAILPLSGEPMSLEQCYLVSAVMPTLADQNVYTVEATVDDGATPLVEQLKELRFESVERGRRWVKLPG